ncbi:hypothetical protein EYC84_001883 [Monilinia fructicola]|uniref:Uncharacterized protein n=1 Tax=Monilinia fructicola TaxID=38448 RepID=A0A5M9JR00_MONFR|nr:hypothetical protein EYC84_001883 [Monilinia fructicola]
MMYNFLMQNPMPSPNPQPRSDFQIRIVQSDPIIIMPLRLLAIQSEVVSFPSHLPNQPKKMLKRACAL